ncbi:MAG: GspH/FimT family pseudopilin [Thermoleophilia bacterium]
MPYRDEFWCRYSLKKGCLYMSCVRLFVYVLPSRDDESSVPVSCSPKESSRCSRSSIGYSKPSIGRQAGFTLIEIVVTVSLMAVLMALSIGSLSYYLAGKSLDTAVTELTTQIREAHALAVSTGNTYRIDFNDSTRTTYTLQRRSGSDWVNVRSAISLPGGVTFSTSSLPQFGSDMYMEFYARGTSENGQIMLSGRYDKSRIIIVDGETVNVR